MASYFDMEDYVNTGSFSSEVVEGHGNASFYFETGSDSESTRGTFTSETETFYRSFFANEANNYLSGECDDEEFNEFILLQDPKQAKLGTGCCNELDPDLVRKMQTACSLSSFHKVLIGFATPQCPSHRVPFIVMFDPRVSMFAVSYANLLCVDIDTKDGFSKSEAADLIRKVAEAMRAA